MNKSGNPNCPDNSQDLSGCFIWKNPSGYWEIHWIGMFEKRVSGKILAKERIDLCAYEPEYFKFQKIENNLIIFEGYIQSIKSGISFSSRGEWFDIDVEIEGHRQPDKVFFGKKCNNPNALPVRVMDNAPSVSPCSTIKNLLKEIKVSTDKDSDEDLKPAISEKMPDPKDALKDDRYKSPALKVPEDKKNWPPIQPPVVEQPRPNVDPGDPKFTITEVYDVAKDEIRVIKNPNFI